MKNKKPKIGDCFEVDYNSDNQQFRCPVCGAGNDILPNKSD